VSDQPQAQRAGVPANLWWGISRGIALACLIFGVQVFLGTFPLSPVPAADAPGYGTRADLEILALGAGLGAVAGLLRPLARSFVGSLLFGVILVEVGAWSLWYFVGHNAGPMRWGVIAAVAGVGLLFGAAFYLSQQPMKQSL
jgi:hypothetical protein